MRKRKFYILGHNPNTLREAEEFLRAGANPLEPDICFGAARPGRFFVSHGTIGSNEFVPENSLAAYLTGRRRLVTDPGNDLNLALFAFDINEFVGAVHGKFSRFTVCEGA